MKKKYFGAMICILVILLASIPTGADFIKNKDLQKARNSPGFEVSVVEAFEYARTTLFSLEGVTGASYTDNEPYKVIIYIESEEYRDNVPDRIKGYETDIRVTGKIKALGMESVYEKLDLASNTLKLTEEDMADVYKSIEQMKQKDLIYYLLAKNALRSATTLMNESYIVDMNILADRMQQYEAKMMQNQLSTLPLSYSRTGTVRPLVGGISISLPWYLWLGFTAGTLGIVSQKGYILSNAHVMAMNRFNIFLWPGCAILQPGAGDGGWFTLLCLAGRLWDWTDIWFNTPNYNEADAAIARVDWAAADYEPEKILATDDTSLYSVDLNSIYEPVHGDRVRKSGRTTGCTGMDGYVSDTHATVKVSYGSLTYAWFQDQIIVTTYRWSLSGDSGSVVDYNGKWVGLLFAGSHSGIDYTTIICKAEHIVDEFSDINWR